MSGARHAFLALTNPAPGRTDDFDRWYDNHIEEVLTHYEGFRSGRRYRAAEYQVTSEPPPWSHLALYEVEADDLDALHRSNAAAYPTLTSDDGALAPGSAAWLYTARSDAAPRATERHLYLALTNATPDRDDDFNAWYDDHHLREIVEYTPGFSAGRRFERAGSQRNGQEPPWRYLAVYQVESEDVGASLEAIVPLISARKFTSPRGALADGHAGWAYTPVGARVPA